MQQVASPPGLQHHQQPPPPPHIPSLAVPPDYTIGDDDDSSSPSPPLTSLTPTSSAAAAHTRRPSSSSAEALPLDASSLSTYMRERPRNRSPYGYSRAHLRSQSHASALAPPMARTHSSPSISTGLAVASLSTGGRSPLRPSSPNTRVSGRQSPRHSFEDAASPYVAPVAPSFMDIESIAEDSELDLSAPTNAITPPPLHSAMLPRSNSGRRRPSSPLHYQLMPPSSAAAPPPPPHRSASPGLGNVRFNEPFPTHAQPQQSSASLNTLYYSSSSMSTSAYGTRDSMPSTPTSLRSRSPSVSSLGTIPDSPDAEEAATEAYNLAQLKAAADAAEAQAELEAGAGSGEDKGKSAGRGQRKRWSVCGAERRTDFEMETIWED